MKKADAVSAGVPQSVIALTKTSSVYVAFDSNGRFAEYGFDRAFAKRYGKTVRKLSADCWKQK